MAQKESSTQSTYENPYFGYAETATNTLKEIWGWQTKTAQGFFDQGMKAAQTWTEFTQTQIQESTKFGNEMMKMGMHNAEDLKKSFTGMTEKIFTAGK